MKHYGDITQISVDDVEPVDVIIGGSPCQDLSIAGKRCGLEGKRSGLFMEQIRIVKEIRQRYGKETGGRAGRFMVWENVPGAFSSNKGEDFGIVLHEVVKIAEQKAPPIPMPKNGWPTSGCLTDVAGRWSVAWRVLDAQFWGVPQRRRRIALVADFGGLTAPEILFERQGVPGYLTPCGEQGQGAPGNTETSVDTASPTGGAYCIQGNCIDRADTAGCNGKGWTEGVSYTLNTIDRPAVLPFKPKAFSICSCASNNMKSSNPHIGIYETDTSRTLDLNCGNPTCNQGGIAIVNPFVPSPPETQGGQRMPDKQNFNCVVGFHLLQDPINYENKTPCLSAGSSTGEASLGVATEYIVRRLTPLECERLQGFPDYWTLIGKPIGYEKYTFTDTGETWIDTIYEYTDSKGKKRKTSDSARYKALGNSIAITPWTYVLSRLRRYLPENATMASLFDGIGGFPLIGMRVGIKPVWASEIEEFCIAVTKERFGED